MPKPEHPFPEERIECHDVNGHRKHLTFVRELVTDDVAVYRDVNGHVCGISAAMFGSVVHTGANGLKEVLGSQEIEDELLAFAQRNRRTATIVRS